MLHSAAGYCKVTSLVTNRSVNRCEKLRHTLRDVRFVRKAAGSKRHLGSARCKLFQGQCHCFVSGLLSTRHRNTVRGNYWHCLTGGLFLTDAAENACPKCTSDSLTVDRPSSLFKHTWTLSYGSTEWLFKSESFLENVTGATSSEKRGILRWELCRGNASKLCHGTEGCVERGRHAVRRWSLHDFGKRFNKTTYRAQ